MKKHLIHFPCLEVEKPIKEQTFTLIFKELKFFKEKFQVIDRIQIAQILMLSYKKVYHYFERYGHKNILKLVFKNISAFIWFTSYECNKNEICLKFLGRHFRTSMKCQNVGKRESTCVPPTERNHFHQTYSERVRIMREKNTDVKR